MHQAGLKWGEKISIHCGGNPYTKNKGTSCTIQAAEWLLSWLFVDRDDLLDRSKGVETMLEKQSEEYVKEGAEKVTSQDIQTVVDRSDEINRKFSAKGPLKRFIEDGKMLTALIKDWRAGSYRKALYGTIAAAAFALIYVFNPFDIVPDVLPIIGAVDDAAVVGACLMLIERDLKAYRLWKESQFMLEEGKR